MHEIPEWWSRVSLRTKVTGVTVLLLTMGLLVAGVGTMTVLRNYLVEQVDTQNRTAVEEVLASPTIEPEENPFAEDSRSGLRPFYLAVLDSSGALVRDNLAGDERNLRPFTSSLTFDRIGEGDSLATTLVNENRTVEWRVVAYAGAITDGATQEYTLVVGSSLADSTKTVGQFAAIFLFFALTVVILGGAITRLLVTSTFTPLRQVEATAARFADGDFSQRMGDANPDTEVGRLNRSLNAMLSRIDSAFADRAATIDQMRRFVGDASHELRTPLVSVRGYAELYRMGALTKPEDVGQAMERIEKEAIRMSGLVQDLLELARMDGDRPLDLTEVDLVPLAHDAAMDPLASSPDRVVRVVALEVDDEPEPDDETPVLQVLTPPSAEPPASPARGRGASMATGPIAFAGARLARLARRRRNTGEIVLPTDAPVAEQSIELHAVVRAEENKIRQVITNLVGNAMRFTPDGSPIEIGVGVDARRRMAVLCVIDHGEGIPPQIREKIFQRFWRADTSRTRDTGGSGLGLSIVASIVAGHRGEIEVVETPGGGATFRVLLPLLPRPVESGTSPTSV